MADTISSAIKIPELSSAPSNPPSGYQAIYAKTDNKLYMRTSAGTEIELSNVAGSGIGTLNTLTATTQTFATGTSGADFNINSTGSAHTFNIPDADTSVRGLITTGSQTFGGQKAFFNGVTIGSLSGTSAGTLKISGGDTNFVSIIVDYTSSDWTLKLPTSAGSNGQVLTTNGSGVTSWTTVSGGGGGLTEAKALMISSLRI